MNVQKLRLGQVERVVGSANVPSRPKAGWIQTIRSALGMTTRQLAAQLDISQSTLANLEKSEAEQRITLQSLRRVADALDCEVQYVLVPRSPMQQRVDRRADTIAQDRVARVLHSMRLEDQAPTARVDQDEVQKVRRTLLDNNWKHLWD